MDKVALKKAAFSLSELGDFPAMMMAPSMMSKFKIANAEEASSKTQKKLNVSSPVSVSISPQNVSTVQNLKMDRSIQTSPDPFEAEMTHCERLVRRGKQNLLAKVNLQKTTIEEQQNTIDDLQRQLNKVKIDGDLTTEDMLDDSAIASMMREFPKEADATTEAASEEDIMAILFSEFDADTVSQAMWLRYKDMSGDLKDTFATGQAQKAMEILSEKDNVEHSAYDLLMQFIAFDAVMPSQTVRDNYLLDFKNEKSYSQKEAEDIACFGRFVGTHE